MCEPLGDSPVRLQDGRRSVEPSVHIERLVFGFSPSAARDAPYRLTPKGIVWPMKASFAP
ncbi:hypothetical protein EYF80_042504 [Liparis tanakae]|uniref:Uncharacterized protein n=1 Tax=Liparis tanakae TaxID=230148 RepID=A0A4Z2G378_9TELE|nr:hypothetical protein EYF80_042504 [Liparis tanakae]